MKKRRTALTVLSLSVLLLALGVSVVAWLSLFTQKTADVEKADVADPPTISVLNNETSVLDVLNLDDLHVPEPKCIVFCVTPSSQNLVNHFVLQLAYTTNMGEEIDLYTCTYRKDVQPSADAVNDIQTGNVPHRGEYVINTGKGTNTDTVYYYEVGEKLEPLDTDTDLGYTDVATPTQVEESNRVLYKRYMDSGTAMDLYFKDNGSWRDEMDNEDRYKYYMLYIHWPSGLPVGMESKETDLLYISAKGITTVDS